MVAVGSLIKSFEESLSVLSQDYEVFRDYFMIFKHRDEWTVLAKFQPQAIINKLHELFGTIS